MSLLNFVEKSKNFNDIYKAYEEWKKGNHQPEVKPTVKANAEGIVGAKVFDITSITPASAQAAVDRKKSTAYEGSEPIVADIGGIGQVYGLALKFKGGPYTGIKLESSVDNKKWLTVVPNEKTVHKNEFDIMDFGESFIPLRYLRVKPSGNFGVTTLELLGENVTTPAPGPGPSPEPGPQPQPEPSPVEGQIDQADGVKILMPIDDAGPSFSLQKDGLAKMSLDNKSHKMEGNVLKIVSREGSFASTGAKNWTSRTHARVNSAKSTVGLKKCQDAGTMIPPPYFRDLEVTLIGCPKGIKDKSETHSLKFGDGHSDTKEMALSNSLNLPYFDTEQGSKGIWARETTHPKYTFAKVRVFNKFPGNGDQPVGLKGIRYNIPDGVHYEMWADANPLTADGKPNNNWVKMWDYDDKSASVHNFGVKDVTYRVDMATSAEIYHFNVRAIKPKQ